MRHTIAGHWFVRFVGTNNGRWVHADLLQHAKWIFAKAEGIESISRLQGSRRGPATNTWEAPKMLPPTTLAPKMSLLDTINNAHNGIVDTVREWISEGWEYQAEPTPAQIAASMLMEADGQASYVAQGESSPEYPAMLYKLAFMILDHYHPRPEYANVE